MKYPDRFFHALQALTADETLRYRSQLLWVNRVLAGVALFMSVVNFCTARRLLMVSTLAFAALCLLNVLFLRRRAESLRLVSLLFSCEALTLFAFFLVSGIPDGFSIIWCCLIPSCGLLLFGRRRGTVFCAAMLLLLVFFFWTPLGRGLLLYDYGATFRLRFPMLYLAFYAVAFFLETIRATTQSQLVEAREKYRYLSAHDTLTDLYNRYGFNERLDRAVADREGDGLGLMILDLDHFKQINDRYGHLSGDAVLRETAALLRRTVGDRGDVCRWGGEEFAVLLYGSAGTQTLAAQLRAAVGAARIRAAETEIAVTVSIGAVAAPGPVGAAELVTRADRALYRAKAEGRDRVVFETLTASAHA